MGRRGAGPGPYAVGDEDDEEYRVTAAQSAAARLLSSLEGDGRLRAAAAVADTFKLDPVAVLSESDPFKVSIRIAAHNYVQTEKNKSSRKK